MAEKMYGLRVVLTNGETRVLAGTVGDVEYASKAYDQFVAGSGDLGREFVETTTPDTINRAQIVSIDIAPI